MELTAFARECNATSWIFLIVLQARPGEKEGGNLRNRRLGGDGSGLFVDSPRFCLSDGSTEQRNAIRSLELFRLGGEQIMDAKAILDVLMQSGMGRSQQRLERTSRGGNPVLEAATSMLQGGGGGGLGGMLSQVLGGGKTGSGGGGGLGDVLGSLLGGGGGAAAGGGLAGGLIGTLAKAAMSQMSGATSGGGQAAAPSFDLSRYATGQVESQRNDNDRALVMIRAMLTAAKADGQIDAGEQERILGKLNEAGASQEMRQFIQDELRKPVDIDGLASEVDSPHMATEVYTASLFAIDIDTPGEQTYMNQLANRLGLPSTLVTQLHQSLEVRGA